MCSYEQLPPPRVITPEGCRCDPVQLEETAHVLDESFLASVMGFSGLYIWVSVKHGRIDDATSMPYALVEGGVDVEQFVWDFEFYETLAGPVNGSPDPEPEWHKLYGRTVGRGWKDHEEAFDALCGALNRAKAEDAAELRRKQTKPVRSRRMRL